MYNEHDLSVLTKVQGIDWKQPSPIDASSSTRDRDFKAMYCGELVDFFELNKARFMNIYNEHNLSVLTKAHGIDWKQPSPIDASSSTRDRAFKLMSSDEHKKTPHRSLSQPLPRSTLHE
ncbi:hypothetical protein AVEN_213004-1 [Araneus ventricosus]|uniref:Uncharacterized protein n=1 Tax=Araneus ventricosus TaxID=182803 RepID=A0A4Y2JSG6_ARAVE|nr:hypothetical protein AVEN_213004-1 [Araneus ventricosus]